MPTGSPPATPERSATAGRVSRALRRCSTESDLYVAAAGRDGAMHRTDLNGLAIVMDLGLVGERATPGRLSSAMQLSAPATSAMLDRLERAGHVTRTRHPDDRRSVVIEVTEHAMGVGGRMFARLANRLTPVLASRTEEELELIATFLEEVGEATEAARRDIEAPPAPTAPRRSRASAGPGAEPPA